MSPRWLARPNVCFIPTTPQQWAGKRTEPPMSVPNDAWVIQAATFAPLPPLDPPGMHSRSHGLWTTP